MHPEPHFELVQTDNPKRESEVSTDRRKTENLLEQRQNGDWRESWRDTTKLNKVFKYKRAEWWALRISNGVIVEEQYSTQAFCRAAHNIFNFRLCYCHVRNMYNTKPRTMTHLIYTKAKFAFSLELPFQRRKNICQCLHTFHSYSINQAPSAVLPILLYTDITAKCQKTHGELNHCLWTFHTFSFCSFWLKLLAVTHSSGKYLWTLEFSLPSALGMLKKACWHRFLVCKNFLFLLFNKNHLYFFTNSVSTANSKTIWARNTVNQVS